MNYYGPRQVKDGPNAGRWHYTCRNDDRIWPVAGCSPWRTCPECEGHSWMTTQRCAHCDSTGLVKAENPCPGHETPEEAREHAAQYVVANTRYDMRYLKWTDCAAEGCDTPTKQAAKTGEPHGEMIALCDLHRNVETVHAIVGDRLGDIWSS